MRLGLCVCQSMVSGMIVLRGGADLVPGVAEGAGLAGVAGPGGRGEERRDLGVAARGRGAAPVGEAAEVVVVGPRRAKRAGPAVARPAAGAPDRAGQARGRGV